MEIRKVLALRGPNTWALCPVLEAWVEASGAVDESPKGLAAFEARLWARLPGPAGSPFDPSSAYVEGPRPAGLLGLAAREFQRQAGVQAGFVRARPGPAPGTDRVAFGYEEEELARACLDAARDLCLAARDDAPFDATARVAALRAIAHRVRLGPSTRAIVEAARARGIPALRLNEGSLVRLGHGARQRRVLAAETDRTGAIAEWIAQDKELTRALLFEAGVPVPQGRPVSDAEDAWAAAQELGGPVVVKPRYGNQGRGVATDLSTRAQVVAAYEAAAQESSSIIVERFAPGADFRLLVVGDRLVAASRREPAQVVGDGRRTIRELVAEVNRDPRRAEEHASALSPIPLDAISLGVLAEQGYDPGSIPPAGATVLVRRNANLSTGGTAADVTDRVHPEVAARAVEAARVVGLDIAGVDVVATAIERPLEDQGGIVVEVNAGPGLRMHLEPSSGTPQPVGEAIVDALFHCGDGRIPIVAVTGVNGKTTTTRLVAHLLRGAGLRVGMTCTDGIYLGERRIEAGDCSGPASARAVLANPSIDAAVLETARGGILRAGLGFDRCRVAVVTNIGEGDHLGLGGVESVEELARVKRTIVDVVLPDGAAVLKADDPLVAPMASSCAGSVIFFCRVASHPVVAAHRARGGRAVFVRDGAIMLARGGDESALMPLDEVPLTRGGRIGFQVENALASAAAAWALDLPRPAIAAGLASFVGDAQQAPGRFNVLEEGGRTLIVDYGHNPSAVTALIEALDQFPNPRRTITFTAAGDRRDADIVVQAERLGDAADRVVIYEDKSNRGRAPGEIVALLRRGLASGRRVAQVVEASSESAAIATALAISAPGELIVLQSDDSGEATLDLIRRHLADGGAEPSAGPDGHADGRRPCAVGQ